MGAVNINIPQPTQCHLWNIKFPTYTDWPSSEKNPRVYWHNR